MTNAPLTVKDETDYAAVIDGVTDALGKAGYELVGEAIFDNTGAIATNGGGTRDVQTDRAQCLRYFRDWNWSPQLFAISILKVSLAAGEAATATDWLSIGDAMVQAFQNPAPIGS